MKPRPPWYRCSKWPLHTRLIVGWVCFCVVGYLIFSVVYVLPDVRAGNRYQAGYPLITPGMTSEEVIRLMGEPARRLSEFTDKTHMWFGFVPDDEERKAIVEIYEYEADHKLGPWLIVVHVGFDDQGRTVDKFVIDSW